MSPANVNLERQLARAAVNHARRLGQDPAERLDRDGMLLTSARHHQIRADLLRDLAQELENATISDLMRRYRASSNTALDAQRVLTEWLRNKARKEES